MLRNNKLEIFENFIVDNELPKFKTGVEVELQPSMNNGRIVLGTTGTVANSVTFESWGGNVVPQNTWFESDSDGLGGMKMVEEVKNGIFSFLKKKIEKSKEIKREKAKTLTIVQFFSSLGQNLQELKGLVDIATHYEIAITNASKAGQKALVESLKSRLDSAKSEAQLVALGLTKYLTEEQIISFYNQTSKDKALKLTWIKNFVKPIPSKILEQKELLDNKFIFDNYVILHYDPNNDATSLTKSEKEEVTRRKKDPIIFGLLKNSRRLYYVGDWIDEYCNLTLDVVIETLGEKVGEINNETVKTYIDRGYEKETPVKITSKKKTKVTESK